MKKTYENREKCGELLKMRTNETSLVKELRTEDAIGSTVKMFDGMRKKASKV